MKLAVVGLVAISGALAGSAAAAAGGESPGALESALGWKSLSTPDAWRGYRQPGFPSKGWSATGGVLSHASQGGGGDLITREEFGDVEFEFQFKLGPKANSGVMWRVTEKHDTTWQTGPEYQVLEDTTYGVKPEDPHATGALYDLYPPLAGKALKPAGEWNAGKIRLRSGVVQHWLNGKKVVEAHIFDDAGKATAEWAAKIAASKFNAYEGFGVQPKGALALQDHGDEVAYRNLRVRALDGAGPKEVKLFNDKDLTGWVAIVPDAAKAGIKPESVWSVKDGVLECAGKPGGYIRTEKSYTNYIVRLQWRHDPAAPGNSGVLLRMVGEDKVWPKSVEAQLQSGAAGDFWNIDEFKMTTAKERLNGRNTKRTHTAERPLGEWNEYEIIVNGGTVILNVNGEELNRATDVEVVPGKICLQSEGAKIWFKNIRLIPLD